MITSKGLLQSKTTWGVIIAAAGMALGWNNDVQAANVDDAVNIVSAITQIIGLIVALFGRVKANSKIKGIWSGSGNTPPERPLRPIRRVYKSRIMGAAVAAILCVHCGCASMHQALDDHEALCAASVKLATAAYLDKNPKSADILADIACSMQAAVDRREIETVNAAVVHVRQIIGYDKLDIEIAIALDALIDIADDEVAELLRKQGAERIPENERAALRLVLGWICETASRMARQVPA